MYKHAQPKHHVSLTDRGIHTRSRSITISIRTLNAHLVDSFEVFHKAVMRLGADLYEEAGYASQLYGN
jgi:hypothetical protein